MWAAIKFFFSTIWGLLLVFLLGLVAIYFFTDLIRPKEEREMRSRDAVEIVEAVGFKMPAVTGEPKFDDRDRLIEQPVAVFVGKARFGTPEEIRENPSLDPNSARAQECTAIVSVRWSPDGIVTLTLTSRGKVIQENTNNAAALTLADYQGCNVR